MGVRCVRCARCVSLLDSGGQRAGRALVQAIEIERGDNRVHRLHDSRLAERLFARATLEYFQWIRIRFRFP